MGPSTINSSEEVRRILADACAGREMVFLVTPYIRFESNFIRLDQDAVHVRITMGAEEAIYALRSSDLHLRFPAATLFMEGATRTLGFGMVDGKRTIRLAIPKALKDDEHRAAYRVERVGRVEVTFSTAKYDLATGTLVNLSIDGVKFTAQEDPRLLALEVGSAISVGITLNEEIRINASATIRWLQGRALGVQFVPALPDPQLIPLTRWVFMKREEELERAERGAIPENSSVAKARHSGVVLVSSAVALEEDIREHWGELPTLTRADPTAQALKEALAAGPALMMLHLPAATLDGKRRLKSLAETIGNKVPMLILGSGIDQTVLFEMGNELKAAGVFGLLGKPTPFFYRLVNGILRRHAGGAAP